MDTNFFSTPTERALYWAGFLAADGALRFNKGSYSTKLELATADRKHIELFKRDLQSDAIIHDVVRLPSKQLLSQPTHKDKYYSYNIVDDKIKQNNNLEDEMFSFSN